MSYLHGAPLVAAAKRAVGRRAYSSMCQAFCVITAGIGAKGDFDGDRDADAVDGWKKAKARGKVVEAKDIKSLADIPAGTLAYWTGGSRGYGHVAITIGGGKVVSTDAPTWGTIGIVDIGFIARTWRNGLKFVGYIINDGDGHQMVDAKAPAKPLDPWFDGLAWNWAGFDAVKGKATFDKRVPGLVEAVEHYDRDVLHLLEIPEPRVTAVTKRLAKLDYRHLVSTDGRCLFAREHVGVGRTKKVTLAAKGPAKDDKQIVMAEVFPDGPHAAILETGHFEYRDGPAYDKTRVLQAQQTRGHVDDFVRTCGANAKRVVAYNDENSKAQASAAFGNAWDDLGARDTYTGKKTSTLIGWDGRPLANGYRPDKVHVHRDRPARGGTSVTFADEKLSDHLPVIYTVGRI